MEEKYYGIHLDGLFEDWDWTDNIPSEGGAAHYRTARTKKELAEGCAQAIKKWVMDNAYISDDYGYKLKETK